jgi:ankyrin repeat protein
MGRIEIVAMLLEEGADVNAKNGYDGTALYWASRHGHTEIARLIRNQIKHKNMRDARLVTEKGKKEDGTPLLTQARRDVATLVAKLMGGNTKRKTQNNHRKNR